MPERTRRDATKLYYSISEVAELVNVKPHVLRYWETQFKMLRPRKNRAGNRSYREKEVQLAMRIKRLLYEEGFTISGARRKLLDERRSGQAQTELNFVGLSQGEFLGVLRRDLEGLLGLVKGEKSLEDLEGEDEAVARSIAAAAAGAGEAGLLREVGGMSDESSADAPLPDEEMDEDGRATDEISAADRDGPASGARATSRSAAGARHKVGRKSRS